jgi:hypothetical protein
MIKEDRAHCPRDRTDHRRTPDRLLCPVGGLVVFSVPRCTERSEHLR